MASGAQDWSPGAYGRFRGLRLRPALDLLAQVPGDLPPGDVVDLGCGSGMVAAALRARWPSRRLVGLDSSPAMLAEAEATGRYDALVAADVADWAPPAPPALIFSNAVLHWVADHAALFPRLAGWLAPGGVLAVQMPRPDDQPSHALVPQIAARLFPGRHAVAPRPVLAPGDYLRLLAPLGRAEVWETIYHQVLPPAPEGHPVRRFTESTTLRPWLAPLTQAEAADFVAAYDTALEAAYPRAPDGSAVFPFRRLFVTLQRSR